jgi:hypothetical protein
MTHDFETSIFILASHEKKFAFPRQTWHSIGHVRLKIRGKPLPPAQGRRLGGTR